MKVQVILLILASVGLSVLAQVTLKFGMSQSHIQAMLGQGGGGVTTAWTIITNQYILLGLFMYGFGAMLWLLVLARLDVSMAYPFVGLGFILTMLLGFFVLGESLSAMRIVGTLLITAGVVLVSLT